MQEIVIGVGGMSCQGCVKNVTGVLQALPGVRPYPSEANMILARVPDAAALFSALKQRGILVKNVSNLHPLLAQCLRFTVGTPDENTQLISALNSALEATSR